MGWTTEEKIFSNFYWMSAVGIASWAFEPVAIFALTFQTFSLISLPQFINKLTNTHYSKPDILHVCRRSHVRKIIWKSFWLFYNLQCKSSACLLVPDAFENNTKSNFHSAPNSYLDHIWRDSRTSINPTVVDDDDQIRIYSRNLLVFPLALHVVESRTEVKISQMCVCVAHACARRFTYSDLCFRLLHQKM